MFNEIKTREYEFRQERDGWQIWTGLSGESYKRPFLQAGTHKFYVSEKSARNFIFFKVKRGVI